MNHFYTSSGERVSKSTIDSRVRKAKQAKLQRQLNENGYNFCEECDISTGTYLDCSHDESVDNCQKNGYCEKAWDVNNITIRCRECHQKHD